MRIRGLRKSYQVAGRCVEVLKGLDLDLADEGITVVLGRSGCGKTTLLRLIAGLEEADSGEIAGLEEADSGEIAGLEEADSGEIAGLEEADSGEIAGLRVPDSGEIAGAEVYGSGEVTGVEAAGFGKNAGSQGSLPSGQEPMYSSPKGGTSGNNPGLRKAKIGMIFQEPRLMPWLTVERNILFGVKRRRQDREKLSGLLKLTGLGGFERARPCQLSGGMQQRVALARALAFEPDFLLMDEPFAALDYFTRAQMQQELLRIYRTEKKGILFVTHSIEEALTVGTQIVILENGICGKSYDLRDVPFPRDLLSEEMVKMKRELILRIEDWAGSA